MNLIREKNKILVVAGAGISTSCGIPDFRSKNGIYTQLKKQGYKHPELIFDIDTFVKDPAFFYAHRHFLTPQNVVPSLTHFFLASIAQNDKLLRLYTQNIDGLEHIV